MSNTTRVRLKPLTFNKQRKVINKPVLYRHFNAKGELLYIGISINAISRIYSHSQHSEWFDQVTNITIERGFSSRTELLQAEAIAIKTERPKYNIIHQK